MIPLLGQLELLATATGQISAKNHQKRKRERHTRVNRSISSIDSISRNVEIVVDRRKSAAGATEVGSLATMDSGGSILDIAQVISRAVIWGDASI